MAMQQIKYMTCLAAAALGGLGTAPPAEAGDRHVVHPGESIQAAVDAAGPGDTVFVAAGSYRESVLIKEPRVTLRGAGRRTVIRPPTSRAENACGHDGNGICVIGSPGHRLPGVTIRSLTVSGFKKNGIWATGTSRLRVRDVDARNNGQWGIALQKSVRSSIGDNTARGNGDAGIFLANTVDEEGGATDTHGTAISGNRLVGNRIGITVRRTRNLRVDGNAVTGNCAGVFVVGDESRPRAGDLSVNGNDVSHNNKHCPATKRLPFLQGIGIVLTGAEETRVQANRVNDNVGKSPLSGGIVLFPSFAKAPNERNVISGNVALRNQPADLANRDRDGSGNGFAGNECRISEPADLCRQARAVLRARFFSGSTSGVPSSRIEAE
ncbi:right-handed parallel beta-helix repeat-containing protein [Streptomyces sp. NPDC048483]|uniref:right-handed parallel beta-helix repeat-containing protein n=1 Tax=Streptomyces sp. NPDC048483 TaxID=3154927 RepID=UPI00343B6149